MKWFSIVLVALIWGATASFASAEILYSQPNDFTWNAFASQNDTSGGFGNFATLFDDFTLSSDASVTSVSWIGQYFNGAPAPISQFAVSFYADSAGVPGALLATYIIPGNANETSINPPTAGYSYSANLATPFEALGNTKYWLSLVPSLGFPPQWGWTQGSGGNGQAHVIFFGSPSTIDNDLAFELQGTTTVPEPTSLAAWGLASLAGVGIHRWRKRRRLAAQA